MIRGRVGSSIVEMPAGETLGIRPRLPGDLEGQSGQGGQGRGESRVERTEKAGTFGTGHGPFWEAVQGREKAEEERPFWAAGGRRALVNIQQGGRTEGFASPPQASAYRGSSGTCAQRRSDA